MLTHETDPSQVANETVGGHKIRNLKYQADRGNWPWTGEYLADERWQHECWGFGGMFNGGTSPDKRDLQPAPVPQPVVDFTKPFRWKEEKQPCEVIGTCKKSDGEEWLVVKWQYDGDEYAQEVNPACDQQCFENTPPEPECSGISDPSAVASVIPILREVEAVMAKNVYPQPDKQESSWGVLCRVRELLARLTKGGE